LARLLPFGKAGGLQILRCKGFAVDFTTTSPLTPGSLKPSDFFNDRVIPLRIILSLSDLWQTPDSHRSFQTHRHDSLSGRPISISGKSHNVVIPDHCPLWHRLIEEFLEPVDLEMDIKRRHFEIEIDEKSFLALCAGAKKHHKPVKQLASEILKEKLESV
jgi:hypothetical protein